MKGLTVKLSEQLLKTLRREAKASGQSVAALIRERLHAKGSGGTGSVYARASALAGCLDGSGKSDTNSRRRFKRSWFLSVTQDLCLRFLVAGTAMEPVFELLDAGALKPAFDFSPTLSKTSYFDEPLFEHGLR